MRFGATAFTGRNAASEGWWEVLVALSSSLPTLFSDTGGPTQVSLQSGSRIASLENWPAEP
jgi:hypothetical protein